jgi:hypothetical protein
LLPPRLRRRAALAPGVGPRLALLVALCFSPYGLARARCVKFWARARGTRNCHNLPPTNRGPPDRREARSSPSTPVEVLSETTDDSTCNSTPDLLLGCVYMGL